VKMAVFGVNPTSALTFSVALVNMLEERLSTLPTNISFYHLHSMGRKHLFCQCLPLKCTTATETLLMHRTTFLCLSLVPLYRLQDRILNLNPPHSNLTDRLLSPTDTLSYSYRKVLHVPHYRTRNVEASLKKTDIAYHQNLAFLLGFGRYAISVFFKNASTLRVMPACSCKYRYSSTGHTQPLMVILGANLTSRQ